MNFMNHYELLCILPGTLAEGEVAPALEKAKDSIAAEGGVNITVEEKGKNRLTYPMEHIRYGYFFLILFEAEPSMIAALQKKLGMTKSFLRTLINAHDPEKQTRYAEALEAVERRSAQFANKGKQEIAASVQKENTRTERKKEDDKEEKKVDMKEIDEKLDALLQSDLEKV